MTIEDIDLTEEPQNNINNDGGGESNPNQNNDPNNNSDNNPDNNSGDNNRNDNDGGENNNPKNNNNNSSTGSLTTGTAIEYEGNTYTVDDSGNLVDAEGNIFKQASEVNTWLQEQEVENSDDENQLTIASIMQTVGQEITDENGNPIEYADTPEGVNRYISDVINLRTNEIQEGTINKFLDDAPIIRSFINYLTVNNGDPRGFGEMPDRRGVEISKDDKNQQIAIIKMAGSEFNNASINDNFIKYLESTGELYNEAQRQLKALQDKDAAVEEQMNQQADAARAAQEQRITEYWNNVNNIIASRNIAGYKLPESITKEINGQKITLTPNDFFDYLNKATEVDANGNRITGYQKDLNSMPEDEALNKEILDAWLTFTGGTYADLLKMQINEEQVRTLRVKSKEQRAASKVKIIKPKSSNTLDDIEL